MQASLLEINRAKKLPFVSDIVPTANAEQYQVWLRYNFANMMPTGKNFLLLDVVNFTAEQIINAWDRVVVDYYQRQADKARQLSKLARQALTK